MHDPADLSRHQGPILHYSYPNRLLLAQKVSLGRVKKLVVYHPRFSTKFGRADGFFFIFFIYSVCGLCEQSRGPLRNGRCCSVLYVAASVTGSTGSAAYTWPTLTKIKTQQEYIRISYVLLLTKNPARAIRSHNGNSSIHQVPTLSIFLALFYPCACNGPPTADWKQCSVKLVDFLSRRLSSTFRWNGRGIICLPSRIPVFLKIKNFKKSRSGRKIGAFGDDKQLIFLRGLRASPHFQLSWWHLALFTHATCTWYTPLNRSGWKWQFSFFLQKLLWYQIGCNQCR